jgi:hypothetical protein
VLAPVRTRRCVAIAFSTQSSWQSALRTTRAVRGTLMKCQASNGAEPLPPGELVRGGDIAVAQRFGEEARLAARRIRERARLRVVGEARSLGPRYARASRSTSRRSASPSTLVAIRQMILWPSSLQACAVVAVASSATAPTATTDRKDRCRTSRPSRSAEERVRLLRVGAVGGALPSAPCASFSNAGAVFVSGGVPESQRVRVGGSPGPGSPRRSCTPRPGCPDRARCSASRTSASRSR